MKRKKLGGENMTKATEDKRLKEVKKVIEEWDIKQKQEKGRNGGDQFKYYLLWNRNGYSSGVRNN